MFAPIIRRAVLSCHLSSTTSSCLLRAALNDACQHTCPSSLQRRASSSKPLSPPNNKKKPTEIGQNAAADLRRGANRIEGEKKRVKRSATANTNANIPMVPPTSHLREDDVKLSAFFSLHRPISIQSSFPGITPIDEFNAIFDLYKPNDAQTIQKTITVLNSFLQRMYAEFDQNEERQQDGAELNATQAEVYHVLPTQQSVENWASRLVPFVPPAVPQPQPGLDEHSEPLSAYDPTVSIHQRITEVEVPTSGHPIGYREGVARKRNGMFLISVKRQRKLKMKKHKYKKLMKRTRLARRKLDRL